MYDLIIPHLHSKAPLPYLPNFVNCFCTKIQYLRLVSNFLFHTARETGVSLYFLSKNRRPRPAPNMQKIRPGPSHGPGLTGGRGWIRTTEALSSRFTVCPHWPLGNTPLFCFIAPASCRATCLFYHRLCCLSTAFSNFSGPLRPAAGPASKGRRSHTLWYSRQRRTACLF